MKARGVRVKWGHGGGDFSLNFRDLDGRVLDLVVLYGSSVSAKRLIVRSFFEAFGRSVSRRESQSKWDEALNESIWLDFDLGAEIASVKIEDGVVFHSNALFRASSFSLDAGSQYADGCCLLYDSRVARVSEIDGNISGSIWPLVYEIHRRDIKNSMIMVDDFDAFLTEEESQAVLRHLTPLAKARGNQLILTTSHRYLKGVVPEGSWHELSGDSGGALGRILKKVQGVGSR